MSITDRIARMRADHEGLLAEARAELEAAVKAVEEKRAALVELEIAFGDLAGQAARARRPRHLMPAKVESPKPDRESWCGRCGIMHFECECPRGHNCVQCGKQVEPQRECYAIPTCFACLPPPEPLAIAMPLTDQQRESLDLGDTKLPPFGPDDFGGEDPPHRPFENY